MSTKARFFLTAAAIVLWGVVNLLLNRAAPLISAPLAARQFDDSALGYGA